MSTFSFRIWIFMYIWRSAVVSRQTAVKCFRQSNSKFSVKNELEDWLKQLNDFRLKHFVSGGWKLILVCVSWKLTFYDLHTHPGTHTPDTWHNFDHKLWQLSAIDSIQRIPRTAAIFNGVLFNSCAAAYKIIHNRSSKCCLKESAQ